MSDKRPERKESGEWAKHLRPKRKKAFWRNKRRNTAKELKSGVAAPEPTEKGTDKC